MSKEQRRDNFLFHLSFLFLPCPPLSYLLSFLSLLLSPLLPSTCPPSSSLVNWRSTWRITTVATKECHMLKWWPLKSMALHTHFHWTTRAEYWWETCTQTQILTYCGSSKESAHYQTHIHRCVCAHIVLNMPLRQYSCHIHTLTWNI